MHQTAKIPTSTRSLPDPALLFISSTLLLCTPRAHLQQAALMHRFLQLKRLLLSKGGQRLS